MVRMWGIVVLPLLLAALLIIVPEAQRGNVPVVPIPPTGGMAKFANGASSTPSVSFNGSSFDGFYWSTAGHVVYTAQGNPAVDFGTGLVIGSAYVLGWASTAGPVPASNLDTVMLRGGASGNITFGAVGTVGTRIKADALPTISSGFGTSPSITALSTPFSGSVNVGTGGVATTGVINFNGTAFPTVPFCVVTTQLTNATTRMVATTTQLTLNSTTAWTASDIVTWVCPASK